jgi:hypothetical protein
MIPNLSSKMRTRYDTWYDFKRDLEYKLGIFLPVNIWLRVKPAKPLPWFDFDMQAIIKRFEDPTEVRY